MKNAPGIIVLMLLVTMGSLFLIGTIMLQHEVNTYLNVLQQYRNYQQQYALLGLLHAACEQCIDGVRQVKNSVYPSWCTCGVDVYNGHILITPLKKTPKDLAEYDITVSLIGSATLEKSCNMRFTGTQWCVSNR